LQTARQQQADLEANELPGVQQKLAALTTKKNEALRKRKAKTIVKDEFGKPYTKTYSVFLHNQEVEKCYEQVEAIKRA